jgi:hypothetical protein
MFELDESRAFQLLDVLGGGGLRNTHHLAERAHVPWGFRKRAEDGDARFGGESLEHLHCIDAIQFDPA